MKEFVMFSGGKDSLATLVKLLKLGKKPSVIFNLTPLSYPATVEYVIKTVKYFKLPLIITFPAKTLEQILKLRGRRNCTKYWKVYPTVKFLKTIPGKKILYMGTRKNESSQRKRKYKNVEQDKIYPIHKIFPDYPKYLNTYVSFPVLDYNINEILEQINNYPLNPVYKNFRG